MKCHILPINDVREHDEEDWCICDPTLKANLVVHNSFDGREHFEKNHDTENCKFCLTEPIKEKS